MSMVLSSVAGVVEVNFVGVMVGFVSSGVGVCASDCLRIVRTCSAVCGSLRSSRRD